MGDLQLIGMLSPEEVEKKRQLLTAEQIVEQMRVSYPAFRAAKVNSSLKRLLLAELITQALNEVMELIIPAGTATRTVPRNTF